MEINTWRYIEFINCKGAVTQNKDIPTTSQYFLIKIAEDKRTGERKLRTKNTKQRKFSSVLLMLHCYHNLLQCPYSSRTTAENELLCFMSLY